jgi:hypothetical protein
MSNPAIDITTKIKELNKQRSDNEQWLRLEDKKLCEQLREQDELLKKCVKESWESVYDSGPWLGYHTLYKEYIILTLTNGYINSISSDGTTDRYPYLKMADSDIVRVKSIREPIMEFIKVQAMNA